MTIEFSAPFNWCDGRCEVCPLLDECPLGKRLRGRRWVLEMRGEDPDALSVVMRDVAEDLERTMEMLASIAEEEGVLDDDPVMPPVSLLAERLRRASTAYAVAVRDAVDEAPSSLPERVEAGDRAVSGAVLVGMKIARVGGYEPPRGELAEGVWIADGVPNLLLIERVMAAVTGALASSGASSESPAMGRYEKASGELQRLLAPWMAAVPASVRAAMAELVAGRHAPSPFCRI